MTKKPVLTPYSIFNYKFTVLTAFLWMPGPQLDCLPVNRWNIALTTSVSVWYTDLTASWPGFHFFIRITKKSHARDSGLMYGWRKIQKLGFWTIILRECYLTDPTQEMKAWSWLSNLQPWEAILIWADPHTFKSVYIKAQSRSNPV